MVNIITEGNQNTDHGRYSLETSLRIMCKSGLIQLTSALYQLEEYLENDAFAYTLNKCMHA